LLNKKWFLGECGLDKTRASRFLQRPAQNRFLLIYEIHKEYIHKVPLNRSFENPIMPDRGRSSVLIKSPPTRSYSHKSAKGSGRKSLSVFSILASFGTGVVRIPFDE